MSSSLRLSSDFCGLALVGDSADGYPGVSGWGPKAAALTLSRYAHLEAIPKDWQSWHPSIRKARTLAATLFAAWNDVLLYRTLATLRLDVRTFDTVDGSAGQARARTSRTAAAVFSPRTSSSARHPVWATFPHRPANEGVWGATERNPELGIRFRCSPTPTHVVQATIGHLR